MRNDSGGTPLNSNGPLIDDFGRVHTDLRISVTDRCNIRCFYCMSAEKSGFLRRDALLTFEEIERFVRVVARLGIEKLRLTGGEPLVRRNLPRLVEKLAAIPGIADLALTTNGILLAEQASALRRAGLRRLNISLDTLSAEKFRQISRRDELARALDGIRAALQVGFEKIKLNAMAIRDSSEEEVVPLAQFARRHDLELRFIEYMPLDAEDRWRSEQVLHGEEILRILTQAMGPLEPLPAREPGSPAAEFRFADGSGRIGLIQTVTHAFCGSCTRLRLTAEGRVRNCLFAAEEPDARAVLRAGGSDDELAELVRRCVRAKKAGHGIDRPEFVKPVRPMHQIGG
ncbi:MAG: GTP 3',8-cyclase MoaA [Pirellulales bacterium]